MPAADTSWMDAMPVVQLPGQAASAPPPAAASPASYPVVAPHAAPDGNGMTNLSDADFAKFKAGVAPPSGSSQEAKPDTSWMDAMPAVQLPNQAKEAAAASGKKTGIFANMGAGTSDALAATLGAPVDAVTGALNLGMRGVYSGARALNGMVGGAPVPDAPQIINPVGGSDSLKSAFGVIGADPRDVAPSDGAERVARGVGNAAASMVIPWAGARALPALAGIPGAIQQTLGSGSAAGQAAVGGAAGLTGELASEAAPDPWKPVANFAGQMVGGGLAAGAGAFTGAAKDAASGAVGNFTGPLTVSGQTRVAARRVAGAITDPAAVRETLSNPPAPLVPGSNATPYQLTADPGLGTLERGVSRDARYAPQFDKLRADQNNARVSAIEAQAPAGADAGQVGTIFRQRLADLNAQHEAEIDAARTGAQNAVDATGGQTTPYQAGAAVRSGVEATRAPVVAQSDAALASAQQGAEGTTASLGGNPAEQTMQGHGTRIRSAVEAERAPAKAAASRLYENLDPDGKLALDVSGPRDTARQLLSDVNPRMGGQLSPAEAPVLQAAAGMRGVELFSDFRNLLSNIGEAQRSIAKDQNLGRESQPYRRMTILRQAAEDAMVQAADEKGAQDSAAVAAGTMAPEDAIQARLSAQDNGARQPQAASDATGDRGVLRLDREGPGGARSVSQFAGNDVSNAQARSGNAPGDRGIPAAAATGRGRSPESLIDFLVAKGGIRDQGGDLRAIGADAVHHRQGGRLVNPRGMSPDYAREAAEQEDFLPPNSTPSDLYDRIAEHIAGRPQYRISEQADASAQATMEREGRLQDHADFMARGDVQEAADAAGVRLSPAALDHATQLRMGGAHPDDAISDAVRSEEESVLQRNAEASAFGRPGVPAGARQMEMPDGGGGLTANFGPGPAQRLREANAGYRSYVDRFRTGAVGNVTASGKEAGGYRLADSQVPAAVFNGGAKGAEAADSLIKAAGSRDKALAVLGDYPAFSLRSKAEEMGTLSVPKYEQWLTANKAALDKFPELAAKFDTAAKARAALDDLRAKRAEIDASNPIKPGWGDAEIMQRFVQPGPKGYEAAASLLQQTKASPAAREATKDYLAWSLRDAAEVKSGPNAGTLDQGAYERWMKKYDGFLSHPEMADVRARFRDAGTAQQTLDRSVAAHVEAKRAFEDSVARHFLGDGDPVASIGRILRAGDARVQMAQLAQMTAGDTVARESIQRAVVDYMLRELKSNNPVGTGSETYLKSDQLQTFIRRHVADEAGGALRSIMSREQLEALNNVSADLRRANLSNTANKAPGGSDTALNRSAQSAGHHRPSMVGVLAAMEGAGEVAGHLAGPFGRIAGMIGVPMLNAAREAGFHHVDDLVAEAVLHPDKMQALLASFPSSAEVPSRVSALKSQIRALAAITAIPRKDQDR